MRPTHPLADLLRRTARRIEAQHLLCFDLEYRWNDSSRCNCGLLVRQALDLDEQGLRDQISRGTWQRISKSVYHNAEWVRDTASLEPPLDQRMEPLDRIQPGAVCSSTGLSLGFVFNHMAQLGFDRPEDFEQLEDLSHPVILARLQRKGEDRPQKDHAPHVALYMREMANWIEEQLQVQAKRQAMLQTQADLITDRVQTYPWIDETIAGNDPSTPVWYGAADLTNAPPFERNDQDLH